MLVEQAFGRVQPFSDHELMLFVGKFDSVFGIEYLENQAPLRTGVTPSLLARYTTGTSLGAKLFYRLQLAPLLSARQPERGRHQQRPVQSTPCRPARPA